MPHLQHVGLSHGRSLGFEDQGVEHTWIPQSVVIRRKEVRETPSCNMRHVCATKTANFHETECKGNNMHPVSIHNMHPVLVPVTSAAVAAAVVGPRMEVHGTGIGRAAHLMSMLSRLTPAARCIVSYAAASVADARRSCASASCRSTVAPACARMTAKGMAMPSYACGCQG